MNKASIRALMAGGLCLCILLLSLLSVFNQVKTFGLSWQEEHYLARLEAVVAGEAQSPWQYRILSDGLTLGLCRLAQRLGLPRPIGVTFVLIRLAQNAALFALALYWYRRLGIPYYAGLLGLSALAWGMTQSNYNSDLAINTYSEILFYLAAAWAISANRPLWIPLLTFFAALNRETSIFIPLMLAAAYLWQGEISKRILWISVVSFGIYGAVFWGLRACYGSREWVVHTSGAIQGWDLFCYNLRFDRTWSQLAGVFGIIPLIAFVGWRRWRAPLPVFFWALVPLWFALHFFYGAVAETRLFLAPYAVVILPAALFAVLPETAGGPEDA